MAKKRGRHIRRGVNGDVTISLKMIKRLLSVAVLVFVVSGYLGISLLTPSDKARAELSNRIGTVEAKQETTDATYTLILQRLNSIDGRLTNLEAHE